MAKRTLSYICQNCGHTSSRWAGRCDSCHSWNSFAQENSSTGIGAAPGKKTTKGRPVELVSLAGESKPSPRIISGNKEFDRVTGGGMVPGSACLVGGDPGIGKSTLLIQLAARLARQGHRVIYVSGEEASDQIRLRAERLGLADAPVELAAETNMEDILATLNEGQPPALVIADSIQTLWTDMAESAPGTVTQVRLSAQALIQYAKKGETAIIMVGHVTKDGQIAGPRVVEHMVDAVFYFEGDASHQFRLLRAIKNRFGPTDEIGVFEMTDGGLRQVNNPSAIFLGNRDQEMPGSAVFAAIEGTRPLLVEIQALVAESSLGTPRRAVVGWDSNRLAMILAVLDAHCGIRFSAFDVYLNVAGGMKVNEPAADLAIAAALISSKTGIPLEQKAIFFGEVALSGIIRPVSHSAIRLKEAEKLGFNQAILPKANHKDSRSERENSAKIHINSIDKLQNLVHYIKQAQ